MAKAGQEQTAGERGALKIKQYFYADIPWTPKLAFHIGYLLAALKCQAKIYFQDQDVIYHCDMIASFTHDDMEDAFEAQKMKPKDFKEEVSCDRGTGEPLKAGQILR